MVGVSQERLAWAREIALGMRPSHCCQDPDVTGCDATSERCLARSDCLTGQNSVVRVTSAGHGLTMILADNETKVDLLNSEAIATTVINLLRDRPDRPVTIGVHGDWGAGKSSVLEMIEAGLDGEQGVLCLKFNGWRMQGFEDAKIALIEGIVTGLLEKRPLLTRAAQAVKNVFRRIDWLKLAKKAGGLALTAFTGIPTRDQIGSVAHSLESILADPQQLATRENLQAVAEGVQSLIKPADDSRKVPEEIGEFRKAFDVLLAEAKVDQLIVLIDDLDRCLPDTAIETLEAVRLFFFTSRTAFVVAADEAMIEYAVRKHFPDLPDTTGPRDYARNYLEKLIQIPFRIPALGETETRIYVTLLLVGVELGDDDVGFRQLITVARERLKRPWKGGVLDATTVRKALNERASAVEAALTLSDQIGPILASGTKGNPRQIKRFLNTLLLRHRTAEARGFGEDVKRPVLAKLMLAERFLPRLFDQIATTAALDPNGHCTDLLTLEVSAAAGGPSAGKPSPGKRSSRRGIDELADVDVQERDSGILTEWLASVPTLAWARVSPELASIDLRPYLFVAKDRKDYFGAVTVIGKLVAIAERLLGPKFTVQSMESDLRQLAPPEAAQVFELVRSKVLSTDDFQRAPEGIDGLSVLVRAQPELQGSLVSFLEGLPEDRLGPWVVTGWVGAILQPAEQTRLQRLLERWAASKNEPLRRAALLQKVTRKDGK